MVQGKQPEIVVEMDVAKLEVLLDRAEQKALQPEDLDTIRSVFEAYLYLTQLIDQKSTTIARLRKLLFGATTEKTADVIGRHEEGPLANGAADQAVDGRAADPGPASPLPREGRAPKKGHGRNGAADYPRAKRIRVPHASLKPGDSCPACSGGTVYEVPQPGVLIRFVGQPPVDATIYELQKVRCNLCGEVFTAPAPDEAGAQKYDATVASMIGVLKYGSGLPFNRQEGLQRNLQIPLPASTQWEIVSAATPPLNPAYEELIRQAAQGEVVHNDDTTVKILELMGARAREQILAEAGEEENDPPDEAQRAPHEVQGQGLSEEPQRKGLFTTGVVATREGRRMALFFSGRKHAGENLVDILRRRAAELPAPIQMCDALSRNMPDELQTIMANCLAHARRQFVEVSDRFPTECRYVLEAFRVVYRHDALARERQLSAAERLAFHQRESGPTMERLREWLRRQFEERLVEPNSALGAAINYLRKHWEKLALFLRVPGAPLDNNLCERALKKAILHRKNALFYKTRNGAAVGDLYMSLIHTCELCGANPFDYLTQLQRHREIVAAAPQSWMPWNYREQLAA